MERVEDPTLNPHVLICSRVLRLAGIGFSTALLAVGCQPSIPVQLDGDDARLTIKGATHGISRDEFEYPIPLADARRMLESLALRPFIAKRRYEVSVAGHLWEIDEFFGDNEGLVVAEIELASVDEPFEKPAWLGEEVSDDPRYLNSNLIARPYSTW